MSGEKWGIQILGLPWRGQTRAAGDRDARALSIRQGCISFVVVGGV